MIDNIKRIGLFMIAAQTFMHFAAGQQYEKYMKIIAGVIVLLLFISPFSSVQGNLADQWQKETKRLTDMMENYESAQTEEMPDTDYGTGKEMVRQLEEEIRRKLNKELVDNKYSVTDVIIEWEKIGGKNDAAAQDMTVGRIRVTLQQAAQAEYGQTGEREDSPIVIERIQIGGNIQTEEYGTEDEEQDTGSEQPDSQRNQDYRTEQEGEMQEYRSLFAEILGVEEGKVEVIYSGGR